MSSIDPPVVIVGAGVSGLACARALADAGRRVTVLERARGVGGRCATRRVEGQPLDIGPAFLHGRDPAFLEAAAAVPTKGLLRGWPMALAGAGRPCQPQAFSPGEQRLAFTEGVTAFPKHLAAGLDVRLRTEVAALAAAPGALRLALADGGEVSATTVVLALAAEQTDALLGTLPAPPREVASARGLLQLSASEPCLTLAALYPRSAPAPGWHALFPEGSPCLQVVTHDSAKRVSPAMLGIVYQAAPRWSRERLEAADWHRDLLAEAERLLGPWAARPVAMHAHRWRWARNDASAQLSSPTLFSLPGGARLGICGDRFAPGGGLEAAWRSGRSLAARLLGEDVP
jgi:predicted NAD/FAD-dependent oxidoreductase